MNNQQFDDDAWKPYMHWQATRGVWGRHGLFCI